ncbi:homeodomain-interacting protein kinase 2-like [Eucyclogobius newberryi]|uniref:homeodomain-interacting protein kinase 2-like n=1 Tax=Eucyclogobius newberryi TaxID=166745 RepID=UPI003B58F148
MKQTDEEYLESHFKEFEVQTFYTESFTSLEELVETFVEVNNQQESEDLDAFIDLLICMLHVDGEKRITPAQILEQPFISGISINILNPLTSDEIKDILPRKYSFIKLQATGQFGQVFKCESKHNQKVHSFKLPYSHHNMEKEAQLLRRMMCKGLEDQHIVQCMAFIKTRLGKAFIYENLDMNLTQFMATNCPLTLGDVRSIVQQTATALKSLKCMRVIHTEVTLDHVWLCAQTARLEVKLTDFQSSIHSKSAEPGMKLQNVNYRIIL